MEDTSPQPDELEQGDNVTDEMLNMVSDYMVLTFAEPTRWTSKKEKIESFQGTTIAQEFEQTTDMAGLQRQSAFWDIMRRCIDKYGVHC